MSWDAPKQVRIQLQARTKAEGIFLIWIHRNPLKSPESAKGIQGNARKFPWFSLVFLG
jgi:hypothetical protein